MERGNFTQASSRPDERLPTVPEHRLIGKIAQGSYGEVWLAETVLGERRAVKIVRRDRFPKEAPFRREFEGIRLYEPHSRDHEGLVDVLQVGYEPGSECFYYVMELADALSDPARISTASQGAAVPVRSRSPEKEARAHAVYSPHTLEADLAGGERLPVDRCIELGLALAEALAFLHGAGLVHRDVKPGNVIFVGGKPKLADPGSITNVEQAQTQIGTEGYIPPEGRGSPQGDVYSLGKLLYAASTGKSATEFPNPPLDLDAWPDHQQWLELNEMLTTACAGDIHARYASTAEMRADLALIASGQSLRMQRGIRGKLARARRITLVLSLLVLLGASVGVWQYAQARHLANVAAQTHLAQALNRIDSGDLLRSLPHLVRALELAPGGFKREELQRFRLSRVLDQCPSLLSMGLHSDGLYLAEFSPDGQRVLTASADFTARVWDAGTGAAVTPPVLHSNEVRHASFDSVGHRFATASADGTARVWDGATGQPLTGPLQHGESVTWVAFRPDGRTLASACYDGVVRLWDPATGRLIRELRGHSGEINQVQFSPAADRLASASQDGTGRLWSIGTGAEVATFKHAGYVYCLDFSPDGSLLATGSRDGTARIWDGHSGAGPLLEFRLGLPVHHVSFSPDGRRLLAAGGDRSNRGEARVVDVTTGQPAGPSLIHAVEIRHAAFSPDARWVATRSNDESVRIWEVATGRDAWPPLPHPMVIRRVQFSRDGKRVLTACRDGAWRVWGLDLKEQAEPSLVQAVGERVFATFDSQGDRLAVCRHRSGLQIYRVSDRKLLTELSFASFIGDGQFSPDGRTFAARLSNQVLVVDTLNNSRHLSLPGGAVDPLLPPPVFSPDGITLATPVGPRSIRLWHSQTGRPVGPVLEHANPLTSMVFSPDGKLLIVGGGELGDFGRGQRGQGEVRVWTVATGRLRKLLPHPAMVTIVRSSPDGRLLLTGCSGGWSAQNVYLWDARTLERCLVPLPHDDGVGAAAFSPDSLRLATSDDSGMIYLWETSTGRPLGRTMRHARGVSCLDFTADGRLLASASADSTARIWDGITGEALSPSLPHPNLVRRLEFSPDGRLLCTVCYQGVGKPSAVRLYRLDVNRCPTGELRMLAEILGGFRIDGEGTERPVGLV